MKYRKKGYDYTHNGNHCPECGYPLTDNAHKRRGLYTNGMEDWVLVHCPKCGPLLLVAPQFHDLVEYYDQSTVLFYCYECGETEAWGIVPDKYKKTTPCKCQRDEYKE